MMNAMFKLFIVMGLVSSIGFRSIAASERKGPSRIRIADSDEISQRINKSIEEQEAKVSLDIHASVRKIEERCLTKMHDKISELYQRAQKICNRNLSAERCELIKSKIELVVANLQARASLCSVSLDSTQSQQDSSGTSPTREPAQNPAPGPLPAPSPAPAPPAPVAAMSCTFDRKSIASGDSVTAYSSATVAFGETCVGQTRTCDNGVLSGSNQFSSCSVAAAPVIDGAQLYSQNCASCHSPLDSSDVKGRSATQIGDAIKNLKIMQKPNLMALKPDEISAIAKALGGTP